MIENLKKHIIGRLGNDIDNLDLVLSKFVPIQTKRNEQLLLQGEYCKYVYFIAKGSLQVYIYDKELNETTRDIVLENNWYSELMSHGTRNWYRKYDRGFGTRKRIRNGKFLQEHHGDWRVIGICKIHCQRQ